MKNYFFKIVLILFIIQTCFSQVWNDFNTGTNSVLNSVNEPIYSIVIASTNGVVLKSTNFGYNFINIGANGIPTNVNLSNVFVSKLGDTIFAAGANGTSAFIYKSINGGSNWNVIFTQNNGYINRIYIDRDDIYNYMLSTGFMEGNPVNGRWSLWKTTDKGITWDSTGLYLPQNNGETGYKNCMFVKNSRIWFGTNNYRVYYSSNYGLNWIIQNTSEQNIYSIWFNDSLKGAAGGSNFLTTVNGGNNWVISSSIGSGNITGIIGFNTPSVVYWVTRGNSIYSFYQSNWSLLHSTSGNYQFIYMSSFPGLGMSAITDNGIFSMGGLIGIKSESTEIPYKYNLSQNYPNPFNPSTQIEFAIPKTSFTRLIVYDLLGKEIETLVNEELKVSSYRIRFDGSDLSSGIYFYKLETDGFSETKKMVLLK